MVANLTKLKVIYFDKDSIKLEEEEKQKAEMDATSLRASRNKYPFQFNIPQTRSTAFYGSSDF